MEYLARYLRLKVEGEIAIPLEQLFVDASADGVFTIQVSLEGTGASAIHIAFGERVFLPASVIDGADGARDVCFSFEKERNDIPFRQCFLLTAEPIVIRKVSLALKRQRVLTVPFYRLTQARGVIPLSSLVQDRSLPSGGSRLRVYLYLWCDKGFRCRFRTESAEGDVVLKKGNPIFRITYKTEKKRKDNRLDLVFSKLVFLQKAEIKLAPASKGKTRTSRPTSRDHLFLNPYDEAHPLFFHHIPKTAGSSLSSVLAEWFGDSYYRFYSDMKLGKPPMRMRLAAHTAVSGHFSRDEGLALDLSSESPQRITLLRDPFDLVVSNYFFTKWEGVGWQTPPPSLGKTLRDELDRVLQLPNDIFFNFLPTRLPGESVERWARSNFLYIGLSNELQNCVDDLAVLLGRRALIAPTVNQSTYDGSIPDLRKEVRAKFTAEYELYDLVKEWHDRRG